MQRLPMAALLAMAVLCVEHPGWAARGKKSVRGNQSGFASDCAEYSQEKVNDGLRFELRNTCSYPLTCSLSWEVRCAGGRESPGARSSAAGAGAQRDRVGGGVRERMRPARLVDHRRPLAV